MIELAQETAKSRYKNLDFKKKNACRLGFKNKFDIIFSAACFHWIADHDALIESVRQALKPGGKLFAQMGAKGNAAALVKAVGKLIRRKNGVSISKILFSPIIFPPVPNSAPD
jgi:trans-aconitate methyltransferase